MILYYHVIRLFSIIAFLHEVLGSWGWLQVQIILVYYLLPPGLLHGRYVIDDPKKH